MRKFLYILFIVSTIAVLITPWINFDLLRGKTKSYIGLKECAIDFSFLPSNALIQVCAKEEQEPYKNSVRNYNTKPVFGSYFYYSLLICGLLALVLHYCARPLLPKTK